MWACSMAELSWSLKSGMFHACPTLFVTHYPSSPWSDYPEAEKKRLQEEFQVIMDYAKVAPPITTNGVGHRCLVLFYQLIGPVSPQGSLSREMECSERPRHGQDDCPWMARTHGEGGQSRGVWPQAHAGSQLDVSSASIGARVTLILRSGSEASSTMGSCRVSPPP
jgi:hypothetical protein